MKRSKEKKPTRCRDLRAIFPLRMQEIDNLLSKVTFDESGCWLWMGAKQGAGYGHVGLRGQVWLVHRVMYELCAGPIPPGLVLDHKCGVPSCCNPDHLEPVTIGENNRRAATRSGRRHHYGRRTHCKHGHPLSGDNLRIVPDPRGPYRVCKTCMNASNRRLRAKHRAEPNTAPSPPG